MREHPGQEPLMPNEDTTTELPAAFREYFWEYSAEDLTWERSRHTIVLRLLQSGGMNAIAWLRCRMSDAEIREFIERRQGRGISPRRLRFWALVLGIPRERVDGWIVSAQHNPWHQRIP
jgi:hypothetical protein